MSSVEQAQPDAATCLSQIAPIAREAGALLKQHYGAPGLISSKGQPSDDDRVYDIVTEVDFAAEKLILGRIREVSPSAVVLAEEGGVSATDSSQPAPQGPLAEADDLWIVDPLDGTINFAHSLPGFCVSIGRYSQGRPVAGAIYDPLLDELFTFCAGSAPQLNGADIRVSGVSEAKHGIMGVSSTGRLFPDGVRQFQAWRRIGSAALSMAYVACGRFDAYVQLGTLAPWDYAAGAPMIEAAGGVLSTGTFEPWPSPIELWTGMVCANPRLHEALRTQLA